MLGVYRLRAVRMSLAMAAIFAIAAWLWPPAAQARVFAQWVELGPDGASGVRASTDDACPQGIFDGIPTSVIGRPDPGRQVEHVNPAYSPVPSCSAPAPQHRR